MVGNEINPVQIFNEDLASVHFERISPMFSVLQKTSLIQKIFNAIINGQSNDCKSNVIFKTDDGYKQINSVILSKNSDWLMLKGGKYIPIQSILNIEILRS